MNKAGNQTFKKIRTLLGYTQGDVASLMGVTQQTINRAERVGCSRTYMLALEGLAHRALLTGRVVSNREELQVLLHQSIKGDY